MVYVGKGLIHYMRIGVHVKTKAGLFNRAAFIPIPLAKLAATEAAYIVRYKPPLNKAIPSEGVKSDRPPFYMSRLTAANWAERLPIKRQYIDALLRPTPESPKPRGGRGWRFHYDAREIWDWLVDALVEEGYPYALASIVVTQAKPWRFSVQWYPGKPRPKRP